MATCRQLITRSLRQLSVVSTGRPVATAAEAVDALESLKALYASLITEGLFGKITDVLTDEDYTADENERVINNSETAITVSLPFEVTETINGADVTRAPEDRAFVLVAGTDPQAWLYDADLGDWTDTNLLTLDDYAPLSGRFLAHLSALLALDVAGEYGAEPTPSLAQHAARGRAALRLKTPRRVSAPLAVLRGIGRCSY